MTNILGEPAMDRLQVLFPFDTLGNPWHRKTQHHWDHFLRGKERGPVVACSLGVGSDDFGAGSRNVQPCREFMPALAQVYAIWFY